MPPSVFGATLAWSVFAAECLVAAAYFVAVRLDGAPGRWRRVVVSLAFLAAVSFHLAADFVLKLRIGWFSYYMIGLACVYFLPSSFLRAVAGFVIRPVAHLGVRWSGQLAAWMAKASTRRSVLTALGPLIAAAAVGAIGFVLDLPGAKTGSLLVASALAGATLLAWARARQETVVAYALAIGLAALVMWLTIAQSKVRYSYYLGRWMVLQRQDDRSGASSAYERVTRYGPPRGKRVRQVERPPEGQEAPGDSE
jgi:hypothetical protein